MPFIFWFLQEEAKLPKTDDWLSSKEALTLEKLRIEKRRTEWKLGRYTAKLAVAQSCKLTHTPIISSGPVLLQRLNVEPDDFTLTLNQLEVLASLNGSPEVFLDGNLMSCSLSLSHRDHQALCILSLDGLQIGCDLEKVEPRSEAFLGDYFTQKEQVWIHSSPQQEHPKLTNLIWSAKESVLKVLKVGLREDTRTVQIHLDQEPESGEWSRFSAFYLKSNQRFTGWWKTKGQSILTIATFE